MFTPGAGFEGEPTAAQVESATKSLGKAGQESGVIPFIQDSLLPQSFLGPFVDNSVLQVLVLAILTACAISALAPALRKRLVGGIESISKVIFGIIRLIMWAAPVAAFGGMAYTVGQFGSASLTNLLKLMGVFWGTCLVFIAGRARRGVLLGRVQHPQGHPTDQGRAADHRRHLVVGVGAAAAADQAGGGRGVASRPSAW